MANLRFVAFRGRSWMSKGIKWLTRSEYSHIAILCADWSTIEVWNHDGGFRSYWSYSKLSNHSAETPYDIWELSVSEECYHFCQSKYEDLASVCYPYDWAGIFGFIFKRLKENRKGLFCSEGAITPLKAWFHADGIAPWRVSPDIFVMLISAMGARRTLTGVTKKEAACFECRSG